MNFRTDINGLRAIALIGVVIFHFWKPILPGGFAGVDVFFVISGFLMTSIIFRGLEQESFRIFDFYLARARRIIPALTVLCAVLLLAGWFYLHPMDFGVLGKHALGSLSFLSNVVYLKEVGYFDEASKEKWLLHTWSLSVEWQFYIIYPIVLVILKKLFNLRSLRSFLIIGTITSLMLSIYATQHWPSSSFFLLPTRAWEMLAGGLAFLYPMQLSISAKKWMEASGIGLILLTYLGLSESTPWPGYWALLPVAGALLVIAADREHSWITGNASLQWLGMTSYSAYLWHWPLAVWLNYSGNEKNPAWVVAGIGISVGLGALSFYLVESRRNWGRASHAVASWVGPNLGRLFVVTAAASALVTYKEGFTSRLSPEYLRITEQQVMPRRNNGYCFYDFNNDAELEISNKVAKCSLGAPGRPARVLLFGDSFMGHFEPFWDLLGKINNVSMDVITTNWCLPIAGKAFEDPAGNPAAYQQCMLNRQILANEMGNYELVVFAGHWSDAKGDEYLTEVMETIRRTARTVPHVIIMPAPTIYDTNILKRFQRDIFYGTPFDLQKYSRTHDVQERLAYEHLRQDAQNLKNVIFIQRDQLFNASDMYTKNGRAIPYSLDGMHITLGGSLAAAQHFQNTALYRQVVQPMLVEISKHTQR
ncbi:MAG: acyltransferase family protein [Acidovorax sp.]